MSAYVVEKKTIDRIVTWITERERSESLYYYCPELATKRPEQLGQKLWNMNCKAVDQRYDESNPVELYRHRYELCDKMQAYKSMRCLLYQCAEGNVPETALYKDLERYTFGLADSIISYLAEYRMAEWA